MNVKAYLSMCVSVRTRKCNKPLKYIQRSGDAILYTFICGYVGEIFRLNNVQNHHISHSSTSHGLMTVFNKGQDDPSFASKQLALQLCIRAHTLAKMQQKQRERDDNSNPIDTTAAQREKYIKKEREREAEIQERTQNEQ